MNVLTPDEQTRYTVLSVKARAANDNGPPLTPYENNEYKILYNKLKQIGSGRISKKRPSARRRRSSKARKSRKSRKARATRRR